MNKIDWNAIWMQYKNLGSRGPQHENSTADYWDERAPKFRKKSDGPDPYAEKFYEYMNAKAGDTLFDMGCGSGTLAIPFAKKGHEVWAADFSQGMLDCMMEDAEKEGVADRIHPIQLDWNEDWSGKELPVCDIAFASRSMFFDNLTESLDKLETLARKRCCLGAWNGPGEELSCCYVTMGDLMSRDKMPELRYITYPFKSKTHGGDFMARTGFIKWELQEVD